MATNESKLKKLLTDLKVKSLKLQNDAFKEQVEASVIAYEFVQAINEIDNICKNRNRY